MTQETPQRRIPRSGGESEGEASQPETPAGDVELGRAMALEKSDDLEVAYEAYQKLLTRERESGSRDGVMVVLAAISRVQYKLGNFDAAAEQLDALGEHDRAERTRSRIEHLPSPATE